MLSVTTIELGEDKAVEWSPYIIGNVKISNIPGSAKAILSSLIFSFPFLMNMAPGNKRIVSSTSGKLFLTNADNPGPVVAKALSDPKILRLS